MIRQPDFVTGEMLEEVRQEVREKRGPAARAPESFAARQITELLYSLGCRF